LIFVNAACNSILLWVVINTDVISDQFSLYQFIIM